MLIAGLRMTGLWLRFWPRSQNGRTYKAGISLTWLSSFLLSALSHHRQLRFLFSHLKRLKPVEETLTRTMVSKRSVASHGTLNAGHSTPPQRSGITGRVQTRHSARLAAEREELLQRTATRKSARIAALAVPPNLPDRDLPSTASDSRASTDSSAAQAPKTPRKPREQVYKPFRDARIGCITPPKRLVYKDSRPGMDDLAAVAPMRDVCPLTGRCRADKTNECAHLADAATPSAEVRQRLHAIRVCTQDTLQVTRIERFVGVAPRRLCLHTRLNLFVCEWLRLHSRANADC